MSNIFLTGINGFAGNATANYFVNQGHHVVGLVRDINMKSQLKTHERCSIVRGDILDKDLIQSILSKYEIDNILHLAAQPIVRICNNDPYSAYMTNVVGTLNVLEAARTMKKPLEKIIVMTSDKAYGPHTKLPYQEDSPLIPADSYCTSKACQDMIAQSYGNTYGLPVVVVRAGNLYGPGDLNMSRLIPNTINRLLSGESPTLYSGVKDNVREFIYIDNIVHAYEVLLKSGVPGEAYNVGGTKPHKILDVIQTLTDLVNPQIKVSIIEKAFYEIPEQYLDSTKLTALGWQPKVDLEEGLIKTIDWFRARRNNA